MRWLAFPLAFAVATLPCLAQATKPKANSEEDTASDHRERLGKVNFPTTCSAAAQTALEDGLALLHSFQYDEAKQAFATASGRDPSCTIAYWGQAMTLYEQLWDFPSAKSLVEGRRYTEQAQKIETLDNRERAYVDAAAIFYQSENLKPVARAEAYSSAMARLYKDYPNDNEAGELYALSLVSLAEMGVQNLANRKSAIAILEPIFAKYPDNPGAAHYLIHACDVPELASEGLAAARVYAKIAPDSAHALHMPSHIFRRLGLWQEVIDSNLASAAAAARATEQHRGDASYQFHAMDFLDYAYLQSGQAAKARDLVTELKNVPQGGESNIIDEQNQFSARNAMELHDWKQAATLPIPNEKLLWQDITYWTRAIGAARSGDVPGAQAAFKKLDTIASMRRFSLLRNGVEMTSVGNEDIDLKEAQGWLQYAEGKTKAAIDALRSVAEAQDAQDSEPFATPAREMLADLLILLKQPGDALAEYKTVLKMYPNRFDALYGAAGAADSMGDRGTAADFYRQLITICPPGADRPELETARKYLAANRN